MNRGVIYLGVFVFCTAFWVGAAFMAGAAWIALARWLEAQPAERVAAISLAAAGLAAVAFGIAAYAAARKRRSDVGALVSSYAVAAGAAIMLVGAGFSLGAG